MHGIHIETCHLLSSYFVFFFWRAPDWMVVYILYNALKHRVAKLSLSMKSFLLA